MILWYGIANHSSSSQCSFESLTPVFAPSLTNSDRYWRKKGLEMIQAKEPSAWDEELTSLKDIEGVHFMGVWICPHCIDSTPLFV